MSLIRVPCDAERTPVDPERLVYVGQPVGWAASWPYENRTLELRIEGDEDAPDTSLQDLAELVLPKLEAFEAASDAYLRSFVQPEVNGYEGVWKLQSIRFSQHLPPLRGGDRFEVTLSIGEDVYGEWSVRFRYHRVPTECFEPYFFSRRQY